MKSNSTNNFQICYAMIGFHHLLHIYRNREKRWFQRMHTYLRIVIMFGYICFSWEWEEMCSCRESNEERRERVIFNTHTFGVLLGLHPLLCSHAVASAGRPSSECVSHSIRCWEAVRFSALLSDILHLPWEAGQPCHSNVKHMWNRPGKSRPTHIHTRTETHIHSHREDGGWSRRQPEPHWSFPLCIRINSSETIEITHQESHFITPSITFSLYSHKAQKFTHFELTSTCDYILFWLWVSTKNHRKTEEPSSPE